MGTNFYWASYHDSDFLRDLAYSESLPGNAGPYCGAFQPALIQIAESIESREAGMPGRRFHIGKRSAAGLYCWDCRVTLCKGGEERIHFTSNDEWHPHCPECGTLPATEEFTEGSTGLELGFANPRVERPLGVRSCSSFSWAMDPGVARDRAGRYYGGPKLVPRAPAGGHGAFGPDVDGAGVTLVAREPERERVCYQTEWRKK